MGDQLVVLLGYGLPYVEIALGVLLLVGLGTRGMAWVSAAAMVAFIIVIATAWSRGLQIECGCFGGGGYTDTTSYLQDMVRDLALLGLSVAVALGPASRLSVDAFVGGRRPLLPVVLALGLVAATAGGGLSVELARHGRGDPAADRPDGAFASRSRAGTRRPR